MNIHQKIFAIIATLAAISIVVILALAPRVAHAQGAEDRCGPADKMAEILKGAYGETLMIVGTVNNKMGTMKYFANPKTLTWTIGVEVDKVLSLVVTGGDMKPFIDGADS